MHDIQTSVFRKHSTWKNDGYRDYEWAVKLNRISLNCIGLWPEDGQSSRQKMLCNLRVLIVCLTLTLGVLVPTIHSLIRIRKDLLLVTENLLFTMPSISIVVRVVIFWWKKEAVASIMKMIAEDWIKPKNAQERNIMINKAQTARIIITCAYFLMSVAGCIIILLPAFGIPIRLTNITDQGRPMLMQTYYVYDVTRTPQYELTFISQAIYIVVGMMSYAGIDHFLGLLVFHVWGQLYILKNHLSQLDNYMNFHVKLKCCVVKHMRVLRAIVLIEDTYNIIFLALFLYFAIIFAFLGFRILSLFDRGQNLSLSQLMFLLSIVVNLLGNTCLYCILGELLVAQCNGIYQAAYNNRWYTLDCETAKDIMFLLTRGTKPIYLTAGGIFPMTLATFCNLLKTSAGYISVLHTTRN